MENGKIIDLFNGVIENGYRLLKYFLAVADDGNFSKAAEKLHVTQPTLSRQLMQLEETLGTKLFLRGSRQTTLTDNGVLFQRRAEEILGLVEKTQNEILENEQQIKGKISIGSIECNAVDQLVQVIAKFSKMYPQVSFELTTGNSDMIKEQIDSGIVDIGIIMDDTDISKYNVIQLEASDEFGLLMRSDDPLATKTVITLDDLLELKISIPKRKSMYQILNHWTQNKFTELDIFSTHDLISNEASFVKNGVCYAVTLNNTLVVTNDELEFRPFSPAIRSQSVLIWKVDIRMSPTIKKFIDFILTNDF